MQQRSLVAEIDPSDPIAAVTHPDPYPNYRRLVTDRGPIWFDERLGLWVVASHAAISDVLRSPGVRTRPVGEPVPVGLSGTAVAGVFARLVRMTDGPDSRVVRGVLQAALAAVPMALATAIAEGAAGRAFATAAASGEEDWPTAAMFALPVMVTGSLLGVPEPALSGLTAQVRRFAAAIAPPPFTGPIDAGDQATFDLIALFDALLDESVPVPSGLLWDLLRRAGLAGQPDRETIVANLIGLLFQSLDATAGLIGNTLRALAARPDLLAEIAMRLGRLVGVIEETARHDPPVQNTRRFVAHPITVAGQSVAPGETLLLLLAAANRDPAVFPDPDRFDPDRASDRTLTFGLGPHRCPGRALAITIAAAGVAGGIRHGLADQIAATTRRFVPSANVRIPMLPAPGTNSARDVLPVRSMP